MSQEDPERLDPDPGEEACCKDDRQGEWETEEDEDDGHQQNRAGRDEQHSLRPVAEADETADDEADCLGRQDQAEVAGTAKLLLRDHRPEHAQRARFDRVHERELDHDHPEPRPRSELAPALAELP